MAAFLLTLGAMYTLVRGCMPFNQPHWSSLSIWFTILLAIGSTFYHVDEGWSWLDSLYFCVITLATVGYGDLAPTTPEAKVFTIIYFPLLGGTPHPLTHRQPVGASSFHDGFSPVVSLTHARPDAVVAQPGARPMPIIEPEFMELTKDLTWRLSGTRTTAAWNLHPPSCCAISFALDDH
ncbi:MAG: potassium channel family protein [Caldilineaceae bacterium]